MIVKSIKLVNFRNHKEYYLECNDETSLILGKNGCGKTSVLEAIYILMRGKSFRAVDSEILKRGQDYYRIELLFYNGDKIIATFDGKTKYFTILDKKTKRLPNKNKYPVILFIPSDLNLISHSPGRRREYFDRVFGQLDNKYTSILNKYEKAIKQRNELLKAESLSKEQLFSWNVLLSNYGVELYHYRTNYIDQFNQRITNLYRSIAENDDNIFINYKTESPPSSEEYLKKLEQSFEKDSYLGHTTFGIHRDDYIFEFNGQPADGSASRGETRSIILAVKFIEAELIHEQTNKKPLILLDDVFSELDETRRKCLIKNFKDHQVIITSVESIND